MGLQCANVRRAGTCRGHTRQTGSRMLCRGLQVFRNVLCPMTSVSDWAPRTSRAQYLRECRRGTRSYTAMRAPGPRTRAVTCNHRSALLCGSAILGHNYMPCALGAEQQLYALRLMERRDTGVA